MYHPGGVYLSSLTNLQRLNLENCRHINYHGLEHLVTNKRLIELDVSSTPIDDITFSVICGMGQLKKLNLSWCTKPWTSFDRIASLRDLRELWVNGRELTEVDTFCKFCIFYMSMSRAVIMWIDKSAAQIVPYNLVKCFIKLDGTFNQIHFPFNLIRLKIKISLNALLSCVN